MRRPAALAYLILAALAGGCATQGQLGTTIDAPIETSIQAVRADPSHYDGKFVEIRGVLDACTQLACAIRQVKPGMSPGADDAPSISVTFKMGPTPAIAQPDTDVMSLSGALANRLYRFSEITAVGLYAATCAPTPAEPAVTEGEREVITVCSDHAGDFKIARVLTVHKRWPATAFGSKDDALVTLPPATSKNVFAAYIHAILAVNPDSDIAEWTPAYRAFALKDEPDSAILCICRGKQCDNGWPSSVTALVSAPANPYGCVEAARANGSWRFAPPSIEY
jgi:hypothetical protein